MHGERWKVKGVLVGGSSAAVRQNTAIKVGLFRSWVDQLSRLQPAPVEFAMEAWPEGLEAEVAAPMENVLGVDFDS